MEKAYAQALEAIHKKGTSESVVVSTLVTHLKATGRLKLLPRILRELKVLQSRTRLLAPLVEVASLSQKEQALEGAKAAGINAEQVVVNPALIRGWRARGAGVLVDHSAKRSLIDLYRRITS